MSILNPDPLEMSDFIFQEPWLTLMDTRNCTTVLMRILERYIR
jgi:hypothetical protein